MALDREKNRLGIVMMILVIIVIVIRESGECPAWEGLAVAREHLEEMMTTVEHQLSGTSAK